MADPLAQHIIMHGVVHGSDCVHNLACIYARTWI